MTTRDIGFSGERQARVYLEAEGLRFKAANVAFVGGEIDLIMQDDDCRVLVEVRVRAEGNFGEGFETVGPHKQARLLRAARYYQQQTDYWGDLRFDVVSLTPRGDGSYEIVHIRDAFMAN